MERFNLKKLNEAEGKEQYQVKIKNRFVALEILHDNVDFNSAWETNRENIILSAKESLGYYELKQHKAWFHKGCSKLSDQKKQVKFHWLQIRAKQMGIIRTVSDVKLADTSGTKRGNI
jgi:hypothetical protein